MAATKRLLAESEDHSAADDAAPSKKQKRKKEKKAAKAAKEGGGEDKDEKKKRKEEKREKKRLREEAEKAAAGEDAPMADVDADAETKPKKEKKDKKEKKAKSQNGAAAPGAAVASASYTQSAALTALPQADIDAYLAEQSILPVTDLLAKSPFAAYTKPTPIQAASWPFTLSGRDAIGVAETGSGKTMAFALPLVESISKMKKRCIKATAQLAAHLGLKSRGADIIVATPGRLKDFMSDGTGFEDDIKAILGAMPAREARQTLMFTATWPASVRLLASSFMVDPVKITIGSGGKETASGAVELQANTRITQRVEVVDGRDKEQRLLQILRQYQAGQGRRDRILVFCLYKKEATRVEAFLQQRGIHVCGIHGDLRQDQRTRSLEAFKSGSTSVMVATDVAARGLDIPEVKLVVNVTFPLTIEDYVHRIGRTGRAGKTGEAITLFTVQDKAHSGSLINILKGANQPVPDELFKFGTTVKKKAHDTYGAFFKDVDMSKKATKIVFD
ncbi:ATP-dependent RNA helicase DBP3 like protein [Verticillium longisporum]|nr:ATP-dependent RNA helicase DBP3 like protein [Verticillium longisporum]